MFARVALLVVAGLVAMPVRADLYSAQLAYRKGDFEVAYAKFRELAELGQPLAQFNLAVLYTRGEGVALSNTFAYAWASIAAESGHPRAPALADELRRLLSPGSIEIAEEIQAEFSRAALDARLMPVISGTAEPADRTPCRLSKTHRPPYPEDARRNGKQGQVYAEYIVMPDGRARHPRIILSIPSGVFDDAVRESLLRSTFEPATSGGKPVPCANGIFYRFAMDYESSEYKGLDKLVRETKLEAESGEVGAQVLYGALLAGLPQLKASRSEALPWFLKAAQAGAPLAQFQIGASLIKGWGCECEENKGLIWLRKAAEADQADAQVALASYALRGAPGDENIERAKLWLERAAAQGHRDAKVYLSALLAAAPPAEVRDPDRALALLSEVFKKVDDDPTAFEIRAAAAAARGDFAAAVKDQTRATAMARKLGWDPAPHAERLERYRVNQPWYGDLLGMAGTVDPL